ncbi:hypothetical protein POM88_048563 [Heracleum sosnowskyi]|uniref:Uncharacterized protein n=1 Tax=Heracleum sosnowskyi TaxID=360622 RepID=A0AAD8M0R8_9APIA|nr:hypothetical protein POM88_048563 [Heracleum sosnowskyi]
MLDTLEVRFVVSCENITTYTINSKIWQGQANCYQCIPFASAFSDSNLCLATFDCLLKTYGFLTPDFWTETRFTKSPYQEHTDLLAKPVSKITFTEDPVIEA